MNVVGNAFHFPIARNIFLFFQFSIAFPQQIVTLNDFEQAEVLDRQCLDAFNDVGREDDSHASVLNHLAELLRQQGRLEEARPFYERALSILETVEGPDSPDLANVLNNTADLFLPAETARGRASYCPARTPCFSAS